MSILDGKPHIVVAPGATATSGIQTPAGTFIRRLVAVNAPTVVAKGVIAADVVAMGGVGFMTDTGLDTGNPVSVFGDVYEKLQSVTATNLLWAYFW